MSLSGSADNMDSAIDAIKKMKPDIVVTDISLKDGKNGIELTKKLQTLSPALPVLILSMHDEVHYAERAVHAGAKGYVMKNEMTDTIINAIRNVINGKIYLSKKMISRLVDEFMFSKTSKKNSSVDLLTKREKEVFSYIGEGHSTSSIATIMNLNIKTIDTYKMRIKNKLRLKNSTELVKLAIEWNYK